MSHPQFMLLLFFGEREQPQKVREIVRIKCEGRKKGRKEGGDLIIYRKKAVPHLPSSRRSPRNGATPSREFGAGHEDFFLPVDASAMLHSERRHGCIVYTRTSSQVLRKWNGKHFTTLLLSPMNRKLYS